MWLVLLASHDQHLDLDRQLIGIAGPLLGGIVIGMGLKRGRKVQ
jgi:hypothetical protein